MAFTLPNGLQVLLVHDPDTDKGAASMDVGAGSLLDPPEFLGLAHFTEHMLFYSSEKYPVEDEYSKFISDHGGHTNAWTASEDTNYQFDVNAEHLDAALDRFAQFFIAPLISADGVEREINAVDSEHGKNLQQDAWRQMQLAKHTANPAHPWSRFATGNLSTLGTGPKSAQLDVREAVCDFHQKHYSANLMRLAVMGRQSLDELQALVTDKFSAVPNHNLPVPKFSGDVFLPSNRGTMIKVVPVKDGHSVEWAWQVPPAQPLYRKAPLSYISHLLGHEGEGSVFAQLKAAGWASSLVSGESGSSMSCASFFYVRVELTEEGHKHVKEIGETIFRYLGLVASVGVRGDVWQEVAALQRLRFDYRDKQSPYQYTTALSTAMQHYPVPDLLLAMYHVPLEWDERAVREALGEMCVDMVRVMWVSKSHAESATSSEPWYGTKYCQEQVPEEWMGAWRAAGLEAAAAAASLDRKAIEAGPPNGVVVSGLHLPAPNPFIPTDLALRSADWDGGGDSSVGPVVVREETGALRMWHRCDLRFPSPKAVVYVDFQCPEAYASPEAAVCTRLFVKLVADGLNELAYPADLAGLSYGVHNSQAGFQVVVSGYSHKLPLLLKEVLHKVAHLEVKPDRFAVVVEEVGKEYRNMKYGQPYSWAMYRRELLLNLKRWRVEEYSEVIGGITPASLTAFIARMLARCFVEAMAIGNVARSEAEALASQLSELIKSDIRAQPLYPSQLRDLRAIRLPEGATSVIEERGPDAANANSAVSVVYQVGPDDLRTNALLQLLVHMGKRDAFNTLRTQQQLGYIVSMFNNHELGVHHLEVVIQSSVYPACHLAARAEAFIEQLATQLLPPRCGVPAAGAGAGGEGGEGAGAPATAAAPEAGQLPAEFAKAVAELTASKLEKPKRLGEVAQRWWNEAFYNTLVWNRQEKEVEVLKSLTPQDLLSFTNSILLSRASRRKAIVAVRGAQEFTAAAAAGAGASAADAAPSTAGASTGTAPEPASSSTATTTPTPPAVGVVESVAAAGEAVVAVGDVAEFKRGCEVWPNVGGLYAAKRRMAEVAAKM